MRNSYLDLRLSQWAEYHSKGYLPSIAERVFFGGDNELSRLEREAHRLTKVKRTAAAIESLNDEYKAIIYGRYLAKDARDAHKVQRNERIVELHEQGLTQREIAQEVGVDHKTVHNTLGEKRHSAEIPQDLHASSEPTIEEVIEQSRERELEQAKEEIKIQEQAERERKKAEREKAIAEQMKKNPEKAAQGNFELVLADPPWQYDFSQSDSRHLDNHYPTTGVEEIIKHKPQSRPQGINLCPDSKLDLEE